MVDYLIIKKSAPGIIITLFVGFCYYMFENFLLNEGYRMQFAILFHI